MIGYSMFLAVLAGFCVVRYALLKERNYAIASLLLILALVIQLATNILFG